MEFGVQTKLELVNPKYDLIIQSMKVIDETLEHMEYKKKSEKAMSSILIDKIEKSRNERTIYKNAKRSSFIHQNS